MIDHRDYLPLPGRVVGPMYSARLYRGPDHLLKTTVQGYHEHFRRFAWEDIQAFVVEATPWSGLVGVLLSLVFLMLLVSFATFTDKTFGVFLAYLPFLAVIAVLLWINFRGGTTCKVYLQTAVTRERLWSLNRVRQACQVIDSLAPLILERQAAAQGNLQETGTRETGNVFGALSEVGVAAPDAGTAGTLSKGLPPEIAATAPLEQGYWHMAGCLLLLFFVAFAAADLRSEIKNVAVGIFSIVLFGVSCGVSIAAVISQASRRASRPLRFFGFLLVGDHVLGSMVMMGLLSAHFALSVQHPELAKGGFDLHGMHWYRAMSYGQIAMDIVLLLFGIIAIANHRRALATGAFRVETPEHAATPAAYAAPMDGSDEGSLKDAG